ncbi:MAG: hypothetical protein ACKVUT_12855 [Gaiella sp.]
MAPFGNRDFGSDPLDDPTTDERWLDLDGGRSTSVLDSASMRSALGGETRRVILRVHGGEDIEIGRSDGREPAVRMARDMIRAIEDAQSRGEWPQIADRFVRPGAIVSIDVQRH